MVPITSALDVLPTRHAPRHVDMLAFRCMLTPELTHWIWRPSTRHALLLATLFVGASGGMNALAAQTPPVRPRTTQSKAPPRPRPTTEDPLMPSASQLGGAWSLPEPSALIERVITRIVTQDKPGAMPMSAYVRRFFGRAETIDAVRRFAGRSIELAPSAFSAVSSWPDARKLDLPSCIVTDIECPSPQNSVWLTVARIERGDLPHEVNVWYTTSFAAYSEAGVQQQKYSFCERWLRVSGAWRYDGFIRVTSGAIPG